MRCRECDMPLMRSLHMIDSDLCEDCASARVTITVRYTHAVGRARSAADRVGRVVHAVVNEKHALCGWRPRSDWSCNTDAELTCEKCIELEKRRKAGFQRKTA